MSKVDSVRQIFQRRKEKPTPPPAESAAVQLAYLNGLENDIKNTTKFLDQANKAIKTLEKQLSNTDTTDEIETKRRLLALYDVYCKLPYQPSKNDVIGIALAAKVVNGLKHEQEGAIDDLKAQKDVLDRDIFALNTAITDYKDMVKYLDRRIDKNPEKLDAVTAKINEVKSSDLSVDDQLKALDQKQVQASKVEKQLTHHLKRVITKFLAFQDWSNESVMNQEAFKESILLSVEVVDQLTYNLIDSEFDRKDSWLLVEPSPTDETLIKMMLRNGIIVSREDSTSSVYYIKLRKYGIEFN